MILISALVNEWRGYFIVAAWLYWEEERRLTAKASDNLPPEDVGDRALEDWISSLHTKDVNRRQHRDFLKKAFLLLTYLYDLVVDPHMEVATLATTVVDFVVAMLLESPFSRIHGTSVRRTSLPTGAPARRPQSAGSSSTSFSRQPSMTSITPSTLTAALQPLQRADSAPQVTTRSTLPGIMRNTSIASALGSLAGFAMGTQSTEHTAPPSPSQSQTSDVELPPGPACNLARYISPYHLSSSRESVSVPPTPPSFTRSSSSQSLGPMSPTSNGHNIAFGEALQLTNKFSPADVIGGLIITDLMKFTARRRHETGVREKHLWEDFRIDQDRLDELEELGLNAGASLLQILPLKSKLYDWALEYYKEPQMRVSTTAL